MDAAINMLAIGINRSSLKPNIDNLARHRSRIPCPRCIGGNMFRDCEDEYVCIQCGHSYYPNTVNKITAVVG